MSQKQSDLTIYCSNLDITILRITSILVNFKNFCEKQLAPLVTKDGYIIIGDIAFPSIGIREQAHKRWAKEWDEEEYYWAADEAIAVCKRAGLQAEYSQISACGGVFTINPIPPK